MTVKRLGLPPATVTVAGIVSLPNAASMFQAVGVRGGGSPTATQVRRAAAWTGA